MNDLPYRLCVGITLFNAEGLVFVGERIDTPGAWQMPQGGVDDGEDIERAAFRELLEETGTDKADLIRISNQALRYDIPADLKKTLWNGRYRGQEQRWVAMRFTGQDQDIKLDGFDPPEFNHWQWVALKDTVDLIVPFKRDLYREVIGLFQDIAAMT